MGAQPRLEVQAGREARDCRLTAEFMRAAKRPRMERIVRLQAIEWSGMRRLMRSGRGIGDISRDGAKTTPMPEISTGPLH